MQVPSVKAGYTLGKPPLINTNTLNTLYLVMSHLTYVLLKSQVYRLGESLRLKKGTNAI